MNLSCGCLLFCYLFRLFHFSPIRSHLSTLCQFNNGGVDSWSWIQVPLGVGVLVCQFTLFFLSIIIVYLFISWGGRTFIFRTVVYAAARRRIFLGGCLVLPFSQIITIGSLVLVTCNWIGASVSSDIWFMPFEEVCMEATHACVFVIVLGGLKGCRWVGAKLSTMMLSDDTLESSHASTRIDFMWWGWSLLVPYFSIHLAFKRF